MKVSKQSVSRLTQITDIATGLYSWKEIYPGKDETDAGKY